MSSSKKKTKSQSTKGGSVGRVFPNSEINCGDSWLIAAYKFYKGDYSAMAENLGILESHLGEIMKKRGLIEIYPPRTKLEPKPEPEFFNCTDQDLIAVYKECDGDYSAMARCFWVSRHHLVREMKQRKLIQAYPQMARRRPFAYKNIELIVAYKKSNGVYSEMAENLGTTLIRVEMMMSFRGLRETYPPLSQETAIKKAA